MIKTSGLLVLLLAAGALAQAPPNPLSVSLSPEKVPAGQTTTLQIVFNGSLHLRHNPQIPLKNFQIVAGPSIENSFSWINGRTSSKTVLTYNLQALEPGPGSVGPVEIVSSSGKTFTAPEISATVLRSGVPSPATGARADPELVGQVEPSNPYINQQTVWTLYLVTRGQAARAQLRQLPDFAGFWAEDLDHQASVPPAVWNIAGVPWRAYPLVRRALFPMRGGKITIGPARAVAQLRSDIFDIFGSNPFGQTEPLELASPPATITVRPVPPSAAGMPAGTFTLKAAVSPATISRGGNATLTATLSGDGRLADAQAPAVSIGGASLSPPESKLTIHRNGNRLTATKTWQWLITAGSAGTLVVPPISLPTFDPTTDKIATAASRAIPLLVTTPPGSPAEIAPPSSSPAVSSSGATARPATPPPGKIPFWKDSPGLLILVAIFLSLLLLVAGFVLGRRRPGAPAEAGRAKSAEQRASQLLERLSNAAQPQTGETRTQILRLREELDAIRFAPQLSSREDAARQVEARARQLARRLKVRA